MGYFFFCGWAPCCTCLLMVQFYRAKVDDDAGKKDEREVENADGVDLLAAIEVCGCRGKLVAFSEVAHSLRNSSPTSSLANRRS